MAPLALARWNAAGALARALGLTAAFVGHRIAAPDATWSGLCFARRKRGRGER